MKDGHPHIPEFGRKFDLRGIDPAETNGYAKEEAEAEIAGLRIRINDLQDRLYADERYAVLVVLQGIDTAGKDSTINSVFQEVGPIGCQVASFKVPTPEELAHDYLWRYKKQLPEKGHIKIFNRSYYESVLVERVKKIAPKDVWQRRYQDINEFEDYLVRNGTVVMKFFLVISKDEQRERLQERIDNPRKQWKFRLGDLDDRKLWDEYIEAFDDAIERCNTKTAPWHVVPSNKKWYRDIVVARALVEKLESLDLRYPPGDPECLGLKVE
ncbi:MAG: polyphosphate kinase 2 family protein [Dehalococcoidia bacterium]|nr:polyphosphate kinase 2 family protein [Dehalococcoidia bacterium]